MKQLESQEQTGIDLKVQVQALEKDYKLKLQLAEKESIKMIDEFEVRIRQLRSSINTEQVTKLEQQLRAANAEREQHFEDLAKWQSQAGKLRAEIEMLKNIEKVDTETQTTSTQSSNNETQTTSPMRPRIRQPSQRTESATQTFLTSILPPPSVED
ncbi:hypothetical protein KR093_005232 [Drosophila rubida]|uniref:Uncharacterized protein n=1 Tax=Drosophila rubida TaxID=30044 RepID=A0AAD4KCX5_9MUSC|nr:hypothetical protein KR093_005232 [Drosophila rubida]